MWLVYDYLQRSFMIKALRSRPSRPLLSKGFTLIELMIAIAIVGVLAAISIPAVNDYLIRARVSEAVIAASACKNGVIERFALVGGLTGMTTANTGCVVDATNVVASAGMAGNGAATITMVTNTRLGGASGKTITLTPTAAGGTLTWICTSNVTDKNLLPSNCR